MEKIYIICAVDALLPDDGDIKSRLHRFIYAVNPRFFGDFHDFITKKFDFYNIDEVCYYKSSSSKYFNKPYVRL